MKKFIIIFLALISAVLADEDEELEVLLVTTEPTAGTMDTSCVEPVNKLERMDIARACAELEYDGSTHTIAYQCSQGQALCCTTGDDESFAFEGYGTCMKVTGKKVRVVVKPKERVMNIDCIGPKNRLRTGKGISQVCEELDEDGDDHKVPYICRSGKQLCCTVSDIENPRFKGYGTCVKIVDNDDDEDEEEEEEELLDSDAALADSPEDDEEDDEDEEDKEEEEPDGARHLRRLIVD